MPSSHFKMMPGLATILLLGVLATTGCGGDDEAETIEPAIQSGDPLTAALANMEALDSFRAELLTDRPEEEFLAVVEADAEGNFSTTMEFAAKTDVGRDISIELLALGDYLYYLCQPEDSCSGWVAQPQGSYPASTLGQSALLRLETYPWRALQMADNVRLVDGGDDSLHYVGTVNSTLALREHQRDEWTREGIVEFGGEVSAVCSAEISASGTPIQTCMPAPSSQAVTFDEAFAEQVDGADISGLPVSTIEAWVDSETLLITRVLITESSEVSVGQFGGTLGGYTLDTSYSKFNEIKLEPPGEFTLASPI